MQDTQSNLRLSECQLRFMRIRRNHKADELISSSESYISTMTSEIIQSPEQAEETPANQTDISVGYTWVLSKSVKK